ncbi:XkdX family protein [Sutterella sp.]|uniref:XkdX family protein n=1 Tax=Sutterella sp. TaxID=1981025 RepID=UPI0026DF3DB6|nr:XkdX family protein [Sutterella sp.]MDO5531442.1 XkdX family protein [Sutterella sp.]
MAETEHSAKYALIKKYYDRKLWNRTMVRNAVIKKWITADEYTEITGEDYAE